MSTTPTRTIRNGNELLGGERGGNSNTTFFRTCCKRQAWIKCGVAGISRAVEKFGAERFKKNAIKVN